MGITLLQAFKLGFAITAGVLAALTLYSVVAVGVAFVLEILTAFSVVR